MLLPFHLLIFLPQFIAYDYFDEITHRKFPAMKHTKEQIKKMLKTAEEGGWTYDRAMFVHCKGTEYLRNFTFLTKYNYLMYSLIRNPNLVKVPTREYVYELYTSTLFFEVHGDYFSLSFQFWQFKEPETEKWELHRVEDLKCGLPKKHYMQESIEMTQYYYFSEEKWGKDMLPKMFEKDAWFKFCDGSVEKYFFHRNDPMSQQSVILHNVVKFERYVERALDRHGIPLLEYIPYIQMDVTVNGRRMQLEYDDDWKMFNKGREYPCNRG